MAHFAQLDEENKVVQVIVVADSDCPTEEAGVAFCKSLLGADTNWRKTSYNTVGGSHPNGTPFRKNYAGVGYSYDSSRDAFIPPKMFESSVLDEATCQWVPSQPKPEGNYRFDPITESWVEVVDGGAP
jgi:hypothetical protein